MLNVLISLFMDEVNIRQRFSFCSSELRYESCTIKLLKKSPSFDKLNELEIRAMKFETARIHYFG